MKSFFLITTQQPAEIRNNKLFKSSVAVHFPVSELEFRAASLLTSLYPGHIVLLGEKKTRIRTFFTSFARNGFKIYARAPGKFSFLVPDNARELELDRISLLEEPFLAWVHVEKTIPGELWNKIVEISKEHTVACVDLVESGGAGKDKELWPVGRALFSFACAGVSTYSLLDVFPTIAPKLGVLVPPGDGSDLSWLEKRDEQAFFEENWGNSILSVIQNNQKLTCIIDSMKLPRSLLRILRRLGIRGKYNSKLLTLWDSRSLIQTASRLNLYPVSHKEVETGRKIVAPEERKHLLGLLEAHLARYTRKQDEEAINRLRDLGYI